MIKYKTDYLGKIEKREIIKETPKQVVYESDWFGKKYMKKEAKHSNYNDWFDTFDEAKSFLLDKSNKRLEALKEQLHKQHNKNQEIRNLVEN